ncbi:MAG: carboxypeptidase-like regulatory domain-containing protein [Prolixibacteraceae bacterium]
MADNEPLSEVLMQVSERYDIKFAYDADSFEQISSSFDLEDSSVDEFLEILKSQYNIKSKNIDGTWVLVATEPEGTEVPVREPPKPRFISVSGYVNDKVTGDNLMYCNVAVGANRGGMTNELGFFNVKIPETDSVRIRISHLGYQRIDTIVNSAKTIEIFLKPSDIMMETVEVRRYEKQVLQSAPQPGKVAFNPAKSLNAPRISNDDLANALLFIPGVNFLQGNSAGLSIRGGAPTDNLVLFDGIPVLETSHLLGNMSVLNSKFVQQAFVSRGGFDSEFGGRVAGLIQLTGKSGKNNVPYLEVGANLLNTNVLANLPIGDKFSITAAWRRSFIDQWENYLYLRLVNGVTPEGDVENPITSSIYPVIQYEDLNAKLSFHPSDNLEFNLNVLYGRDNQEKDFALLQTSDYFRNEYAHGETMGFSLNWNWQAGSKWFHSFTAGYSTLEKNNADETGELKEFTEVVENPALGKGKGKGKGLLNTREKTYEKLVQDVDNGFNNVDEYRASWKSEFQTGAVLNKAGIGWTANEYSYSFYASRSEAFVPVDSLENSASLFMVNAFLQQNISVTDKAEFRWGIRTNTDLTSGKTYWQPRGGIEYKPLKGLSFHFLSGVYHQFLSGIKRIDSEGRYNQIWYLSGAS